MPKNRVAKPSSKSANEPMHPGQYARESVLTAKGLTVGAAAKLIGVGRPALSNFLNGHVAATPDMARRIEVAFGVSARVLLQMQAAYEVAQSEAKGSPADATRYVVPFLQIKASDIETWASRKIAARLRLSVLLRTLVNSTGSAITKIDFPGNDDAERPGWDGYVEATQASPWVPAGASGWEFGVNQQIKAKADGDFAKSIRSTDRAERDRTTFVFVTPRHWPGKVQWAKENKAKGQWRDVRAYDSSDLEQWFEQSIPAQAWFANETLRHSHGVRSLDRCWADWADQTNPPLAGSLFTPAVDGSKRTVLSRLSGHSDGPTVIAADSTEEALAFLAQLFGSPGGKELEAYRDRILVFDTPGVLPRLAQGAKDFIPVAASREVEREFGLLDASMHTIVVYPRNAANGHPHVILEPLSYEMFQSALQGMGYTRDDVAKYSNQSGRSLTVLRRQLSNVPAVRTPAWAASHETAASLIPFLFIGAWDSRNISDQTVLTLLAGVASYDELERSCSRLASLNDAPLWSVGTYRGVISKIDLLFAIAGAITRHDLDRYFGVAKIVLGEDDPKLDLPEEERWLAALHGKSREFSTALREGILETLVLLAVHGNHRFRSRLGFDCEIAVTALVRELLSPLTTRILEANDRDLAGYAEAAPDEFLSILEEDLKTERPQTYGLMRAADASVFGGGCPRAGLLRALEALAWNPETLPRAALALAQLATFRIDDRWSNKPIHSLEAIFRAWMPQTAADQERRLRVMRLLEKEFSAIAWQICIEQISTGERTGGYSHKPRWRNDGYGFGEPFETWGPTLAFVREMVDMALNWKGGYTRDMLCALVQRLPAIPENHQDRVWGLVKAWADSGASDADKAYVRESIRVTTMSRRSSKRSKVSDYARLSVAGRALYSELEPSDVLYKHEWLFRQNWVEESAGDVHEDGADFGKRDERIANLRVEALREILGAHGFDGLFTLAQRGNAAFQIGSLTARRLLTAANTPDFLLAALPHISSDQAWASKNVVAGVLNALEDEADLANALGGARTSISQADFARLLVLAPFRRSTWYMADTLDEQHSQTYWNAVVPDWINDANDESNEAVERLLAAHRPRAAFACCKFRLDAIAPELLFRLMSAIARGDDEPSDRYQLEPHYIEQAFALIDRSPALTIEEKAGLELSYIDVLSEAPWGEGDGDGMPNLERYVEGHPELFVQAVVWTYKRDSEGEDPLEWRVPPELVQRYAERGYKLLEALRRTPGRDNPEEPRATRLAEWLENVRNSCADLGRLDIADVCLGKLLSHASEGQDGVWPCEPVREAMESIRSREMMRGARTGLYNSRGVSVRGRGGDQERALAERYRRWANALQYSHPFVASELLMGMARRYEDEAHREDIDAGIRRRLH